MWGWGGWGCGLAGAEFLNTLCALHSYIDALYIELLGGNLFGGGGE